MEILNKNYDDSYATADFYSACLLYALSFRLENIIKRPGELVAFVFSDDDHTAEKCLKDHWDGNVVINTRDIINSIKELKVRMHLAIKEGSGSPYGK